MLQTCCRDENAKEEHSFENSPNQVLTHAARAAAKQLNKLLSATSGGRARRARRALVRANSKKMNMDFDHFEIFLKSVTVPILY